LRAGRRDDTDLRFGLLAEVRLVLVAVLAAIFRLLQ
jgi:hypothetical protein